mgnify:CR=1 FL=1
MRAGGGKGKGAAFEREVCRDLSRFVDPKGTDTLFWRSAISGGRATVERRKGIKNRTQLGDITCIHKSGHWLTELFYLECKFYRDLDLASSLLFGKGKLAAFWRETVDKATECEREPLLIARQNRTDALVVFSASGLVKFKSFGYKPNVYVTSFPLMPTAFAKVCLYKETFK